MSGDLGRADDAFGGLRFGNAKAGWIDTPAAPVVQGMDLVGPECTCGEPDYPHRHVKGVPVVQGDEGLREAIAQAIWESGQSVRSPWPEISETTRVRHRERADAILALPEMRSLLADAAAGREAVAAVHRVRELAVCPDICDDDCEADCHEGHHPRFKRMHQPEHCPGVLIRRALDGEA